MDLELVELIEKHFPVASSSQILTKMMDRAYQVRSNRLWFSKIA